MRSRFDTLPSDGALHVSDGGEDQGAEEAFMGQKKEEGRIITSVWERAVSRERLFLLRER